jgi:hypothetical protein
MTGGENGLKVSEMSDGPFISAQSCCRLELFYF